MCGCGLVTGMFPDDQIFYGSIITFICIFVSVLQSIYIVRHDKSPTKLEVVFVEVTAFH